MPSPKSSISRAAHPGVVPSPRRTTWPPEGVNLTAFERKLSMT